MTNPYEGLEPAIQESFRRLSCSGVGTKKADRLAAGLLVASIAINLKRIADAHEPKPKATRRIRRRG